MKIRVRLGAIAVSAIVLIGTAATVPASALEERSEPKIAEADLLQRSELSTALISREEQDSTSVGWIVVNTDTGATFTNDDLVDLIPEPTSLEDSTVTPNLIDDPIAWDACFGPVLNVPDYPLATYPSVAMATGTFYLQCGPLVTKTFGWHHIQNNHQSQWEQRVSDMLGVPYGTWGTPLWDDFMEGFIRQTLPMPGGVTVEYGGKRCYTARFDVYRVGSNGQPEYRYTFNPTTILSMTNNRVITSYPTTNQDCTRQAPWW